MENETVAIPATIEIPAPIAEGPNAVELETEALAIEAVETVEEIELTLEDLREWLELQLTALSTAQTELRESVLSLREQQTATLESLTRLSSEVTTYQNLTPPISPEPLATDIPALVLNPEDPASVEDHPEVRTEPESLPLPPQKKRKIL